MRAVAAALTFLSTLCVSRVSRLREADDDRISQWAFDLLEALPNAHYNADDLRCARSSSSLIRMTAPSRPSRDGLPSGEPDARHVRSAVQFYGE